MTTLIAILGNSPIFVTALADYTQATEVVVWYEEKQESALQFLEMFVSGRLKTYRVQMKTAQDIRKLLDEVSLYLETQPENSVIVSLAGNPHARVFATIASKAVHSYVHVMDRLEASRGGYGMLSVGSRDSEGYIDPPTYGNRANDHQFRTLQELNARSINDWHFFAFPDSKDLYYVEIPYETPPAREQLDAKKRSVLVAPLGKSGMVATQFYALLAPTRSISEVVLLYTAKRLSLEQQARWAQEAFTFEHVSCRRIPIDLKDIREGTELYSQRVETVLEEIQQEMPDARIELLLSSRPSLAPTLVRLARKYGCALWYVFIPDARQENTIRQKSKDLFQRDPGITQKQRNDYFFLHALSPDHFVSMEV